MSKSDADLVRPAGEPGRSSYGEALEIWDQRTYRAASIEVVNDGRDGKPAILRTTGADDRFPLIESILGESEGTLGVTVTVDYVLAPDSDTVQRIVRPTAGPDGLRSRFSIAMSGVLRSPGVPILASAPSVGKFARFARQLRKCFSTWGLKSKRSMSNFSKVSRMTFRPVSASSSRQCCRSSGRWKTSATRGCSQCAAPLEQA
mgnify:CR=1 FL=1